MENQKQKKTIDTPVSQVMNRYKFSSLTKFNAVLRQCNVMADRGKEGMIMFNKNWLIHSMLDARGNKIGVPIKASALLSKSHNEESRSTLSPRLCFEAGWKGPLTNG